MNNGNPSAPQNAPPNLSNLIKPEQVTKLQYFPDDQKPKYLQGITRLWETINTQQPDSQDYQQAFKKLYEVTQNVRRTIQTTKDKAMAAAAAQQNGGRPPSQQGPQANQPQTQGEASQQPTKPEQFSAKVMQKVEQLTVYVPPAFLAQQGPDAGPRYIGEMKKKYAAALNGYERNDQQLSKMTTMMKQRNAAGKPFSQQEQATYDAQASQCQQQKDRSLEYIRGFQKQQESIKAQLERTQGGNAENGQNGQATKPEGNAGVGGTSQAPEHQGQAHTVSSALDAARSQANNGSSRPSAMSPPKSNGQPQKPSTNQPSSTQQPQAPQPHVNNIKAEAQPHLNSPGIAPSHPTAPHLPGDPQPLKHEDALEKARSYSNGPGYPQNTPQSATHGHPPPHNQRESQPNSHSKMPVPKDLPHIPPQPVSMGQSRPTMTNGPLPMGPIGQPNIQRNPGYVLEGDGERVLSKKKLEELVRQVTGGTGGEGEDGESITADVEEVSTTQPHLLHASSLILIVKTLLNVADDFVDQVIVSACKLAKLRSSSTLELRDIQLILERNYNIRVPGYASDELRTVKKIQPAPAWTQKLSAVNAAKVTGGKGE